MKTKVLKAVSELLFNVVIFAMSDNNCTTLQELATKLAHRYNPEDIAKMKDDLIYAYNAHILS